MADDIEVHVASFNTCLGTELCLRSLRRFAGRAFTLTVGDSGSTDGSVEMLRTLESEGWLRLEVEPGRRHPEWLKEWCRREGPRFSVFVDSDVEFLGGAWLPPLIEAAERGAALVAAEMVPEVSEYVEPVGLRTISVAGRPSPWLLLVDRQRTRELDLEFGESSEEDRFYDVGARLLPTLRDNDLTWAVMPPDYRRRYHHYGGLSSAPGQGYRGAKKRHDGWVIERRLRAFRARHDGPWRPASLLGLIPPWAGRYRFSQRILQALA